MSLLKSMNQTRPANYYANQVKLLILILVSVLIAKSPPTRQMISDVLYTTSEMIRPK